LEAGAYAHSRNMEKKHPGIACGALSLGEWVKPNNLAKSMNKIIQSDRRLPGSAPTHSNSPGQPQSAFVTRLSRISGLLLGGCLAFLLVAAAGATTPLSITSKSLANATVGSAYNQILAATGGKTPYRWTVAAGSLPDGLKLNPTNGVVTGTALNEGSWIYSYPFDAYIQVKDSLGAVAAASFSLSVLPASVAKHTLTVINGSGSGSYVANTTVAISANAAPTGKVFSRWTGATVANPAAASTTLVMPATNTTVTANYTNAPATQYTLTVVSGTGGGSYAANTTVAISANAAPTGKVFSRWTGATVANPAAASTTLVMPATNTTVTANYTPVIQPLAITTTSLPPAIAGSPYAFSLAAAGGKPPYSWLLVAGDLPIGLNLGTNGQISGTPAADASWEFTYPFDPYISVTDSASNTTASSFSMQLLPPTNSVYALTVVNGSGSGAYAANTTVAISANAAPAGLVFANWTGAAVASSASPNTTLVMPALNTAVTANFASPPPAITNVPQPVTTHPRLWITPADLPRLRSWATTSNPIYGQGLIPLLDQAITDYSTQFFPGGVANPTYPDLGDSQGYTGLLSEQYAFIFGLHALIDPDPAARILHAQRARNLIMYAMDQAVLGPLAGAPFRDPSFPIYNRAGLTSEAWPLVVDWIYSATNAVGQPILTAHDKATIRNVFLIWANECLNASTTGGDHPEPVGAMNDPSLLPGGNAYRMAANNYYLGHARLLTLMSLAIDPVDDPVLDTNAVPAQLGNTLRSYILDATGAWLYQEFTMFGDPGAVQAAYHLPATASVGLASGGLPPEGMLYGESFAAVFGQLLALKTAGFADPAISGPQAALINNPPVWNRFVQGFISSLAPTQITSATEPWLGEVYEFASYGDVLELYCTPDLMCPFALLSLLDRQNGDSSRLNAERWFAINAVEGGASTLLSRVQNPWSWGVQDALYAFLLLDPSATTAPPQTSYPTAFYDAPAGRLVDRTDWSTNASLFDFRCSWISINHQQADANQFEFYRKGEWLTKGVANYDNNFNGLTTDFHNTLSLKNWCAAGTPANLGWYEGQFWTNGSQWQLGSSAGDPSAYVSAQPAYSYAFGDTTPLYNRPSPYTPENAALDILHASRSILWLKPDHIVVYDRATSQTAGLFKHFNLAVTAPPSASGKVITVTTPGGQHLAVTSLLPTNAALTVVPIGNSLNPMADLEPSTHRIVIEDPNDPTDTRFLHVLQGTDATGTPDVATLFHSSLGAAMDGAVFGNEAVLFMVDAYAGFSGVTYSVPATVVNHFVTGLTPGAYYGVSTSALAGGFAVSLVPAASGHQADSAGVLVLNF